MRVCACASCRRYAEILGQQHALHELQAPQREQIVGRAQSRMQVFIGYTKKEARDVRALSNEGESSASGARLMSEGRANVSYDWVVRYAPTPAPRLGPHLRRDCADTA